MIIAFKFAGKKYVERLDSINSKMNVSWKSMLITWHLHEIGDACSGNY